MLPRESGREGELSVNQGDRNESGPYQNPGQPYGQPPYQNPGQPYGQPPYQNPGQPYGQPPYQNPGQLYGQPPYYAPQPPSPEMQQKAARSWLRRAGNHAFLMPILTTVLQLIIAVMIYFVWAMLNMKRILPIYRRGGIPGAVKYLTSQTPALIALAILSVLLSMVITILIGRPMLGRKIFGAWKRPKWTASGFAKCLVCAFGIAGVGELIAYGMEILCKATGLRLNMPNLNMTGNQTSDIILIAYICVLGPLLEETLFRGMILQSLRPWGDKLAIIVSAVLFGLAHLNFFQGIPAVLIGLLFGFVTVKTGSVVPSSLLHILYNSLSMAMMANGIDSNQALQTGYIIFLAAAVLVSILLLVLRRFDFSDISTQPAPSVPAIRHPYRIVFLQSAAFWVLIACFALFSFVLSNSPAGMHM